MDRQSLLTKDNFTKKEAEGKVYLQGILTGNGVP
jgi:hypothetical protein